MKIEQFQLYKDDPMVTLTAYILDDSPEMLNGAKRPAAQAKEQIRPDVAVWMILAETWLQKRFALDLPDKCPDWREALGLD